ncbi:hypothetical protein [Rhodococcus sp. NPDC060176]|uniref:hypothetical protein n=1 Tax=Rhodococcus sp. NPDC060176 TaxID=3347062 RepID=UPI00365D7F51
MLNAARVFCIDGQNALPFGQSTLKRHNLVESDLERWVVANPDVLGTGVQIVATQYDKWALPSGDREKSRLDVLALDPSGQLIVVKVKARLRQQDTSAGTDVRRNGCIIHHGYAGRSACGLVQSAET